MTVVFVPSGGASVVASTIVATEVSLFSTVVVVTASAATTVVVVVTSAATVVVVATSAMTTFAVATIILATVSEATIVLAMVLVGTIVVATVATIVLATVATIVLATVLVASIIEAAVITSLEPAATIATFAISSKVSGAHVLLVTVVIALVVGVALLLDNFWPSCLSDLVLGWYLDLFHLDTSHVFNSVEEFSVPTIEEGDADATVASSGSSTRPMDVGLGVFWWLQLDDKLDIWNIDSSGSDICGNQNLEFVFFKSL